MDLKNKAIDLIELLLMDCNPLHQFMEQRSRHISKIADRGVTVAEHLAKVKYIGGPSTDFWQKELAARRNEIRAHASKLVPKTTADRVLAMLLEDLGSEEVFKATLAKINIKWTDTRYDEMLSAMREFAATCV